jgi:hypothetical protein
LDTQELAKQVTNNYQAAAHILATLDERGTKLIPKTKITDTTLQNLQQRSVGPDLGQIDELEAMGLRHLGCGQHEI